MALRRVLVVEHDASQATELTRMLSEAGCTVVWARDGHDALRLLPVVRPAVICLALWLPGLDGLDILHTLRQVQIETAVIMLSGHGTTAAAVKAIQLGAWTFLDQPVDPEQLRQAVWQAVPSPQWPTPVSGTAASPETASHGRWSPPVARQGPDCQPNAWPPVVPRPPQTSRTTRSPGPNVRQRTLGRSVLLTGHGLQSGQKTGMILTPLPPRSGVVFRDLVTRATVPALVQYVDSTEASTNLRGQGIVVRTVEHLLSVLYAYGLTNVQITVCGEIPILDGSALDICRSVEQAGVVEQDASVEEFVVDRCYRIGDETPTGKSLLVEPYDGFKVTYRLAYPPPLGVQLVTYEHRHGAGYRQAIAPARTFAFLREVEHLHDQGLMAGGRLNNVVLLGEGTVLTGTGFRFADECARHKVLDIMGDLYLLGTFVRGHVQANMSGHTDNIALVAQLAEAMRARGAAAVCEEMTP